MLCPWLAAIGFPRCPRQPGFAAGPPVRHNTNKKSVLLPLADVQLAAERKKVVLVTVTDGKNNAQVYVMGFGCVFVFSLKPDEAWPPSISNA